MYKRLGRTTQPEAKPLLCPSETLTGRMERTWGELPRYRGIRCSADGASVVSGVQLGNVFIAVQPLLGLEGDPMRLLFERDLTPHPQVRLALNFSVCHLRCCVCFRLFCPYLLYIFSVMEYLAKHRIDMAHEGVHRHGKLVQACVLCSVFRSSAYPFIIGLLSGTLILILELRSCKRWSSGGATLLPALNLVRVEQPTRKARSISNVIIECA